MDNGEMQSRLGSQAGFNFVVASAVFLLFKYGFRGLLWWDAVYIVVGYVAAAVVVGTLNWRISSWCETRWQEKFAALPSPPPLAELLVGSDRIDQVQKQARRLGTLLWFMSLSIGFACVMAYDVLLPR
jgi:hypothetical protein